jgi:hypothetical protein
MALTDFEKECIEEVLGTLQMKDYNRRTDEQQADYDTITKGTEAERQVVIAAYIADDGLAKVAVDITSCDSQTADIAVRKTALEVKQTAMQNYGT